MKIPLLILGLLVYASSTSAQKVQTVVVTAALTNDLITIAAGEVVRVSMVRPEPYRPYDTEESRMRVEKSGVSTFIVQGDVISGPARFFLASDERVNAWLTLEWIPAQVDPRSTMIVPQSTNAVAVSMEWSTNLVNWSEGTNGVYSTADAAKFFRVKVSP